MTKRCFLISIALLIAISAAHGQGSFQFPFYLRDSFNPLGKCWTGMDENDNWPVYVEPERYLAAEPPALDISGVTIPLDQWVELEFAGQIIDGPGDDILLAELDQMGEKALVFLTDGFEEEYLFGMAAMPFTSINGVTKVSFDIAALPLSFVPKAVKIVGIDMLGGSPGFDLAYVQARTQIDYLNTASNPFPPDRAENIPIDTVLSWYAGNYAISHYIYMGQSPADVDANAVPLDQLILVEEKIDYNPGVLDVNTTYYWRIDEVNAIDNTIETGDIWQFKTVEYLDIDNFESYSMSRNSWENTGLGNMFPSKEIYHGCKQSMACYYFCNNTTFSEVTRFYEPAEDWSGITEKELNLYFRGFQGNKIDIKMVLAVGDGVINATFPYTGDPNNYQSPLWQPWTIDLNDIPDFNYSNIEYIAIGFVTNTPDSTTVMTGLLFFDDITLSHYSCDEQNSSQGDVNCDCVVNFNYFPETANNWLETENNIYPVEEPNQPVAWYKFEGNANDSIGSADAMISGSPAFVPGIFGQAIEFDGYNDYLEVSDAESIFSEIRNAVTICFWQNGADSNHYLDTLFCTNFEYNLYDPTISINIGCWKPPGRYNWDCGSPLSYNKRLSGKHQSVLEWQQQWNHWAFTKDADNGTMQVFLNGRLIDSRTGSDSLITDIDSFTIGSGWYGGYDGLMDELQIFDYVLTQPEIVYTATNGTGVFNQQLAIPADLNVNTILDFTDFSILAEQWLGK